MNTQTSRRGWLIAILAITLVSGACGPTSGDRASADTSAASASASGPGGDKAGGANQAPRVLTLANADSDDSRVQPFAEALKSLSSGTLVVDTTNSWRAGNQSEGELIRDVEAGTVDLGASPTRSFDTVGINSFEALQAPFLIDTTALEVKVLSSPIQGQMLDGLGAAGLVGLAIVPGPLRRLLGRSRALMTVEDFRGATIGIIPSRLTEKTFQALGAKAVAFAPGGPVSIDTLDGIETSLGAIDGNGYDAGAVAVTSNIDMWPRPSAIFANAKVFNGMTAEQQGWLREAGSRAGIGVLTKGLEADATSGAILCRRNLRFVDATAADLAALRQAVEPVYADLDSDPATKAFIEQIQAIRGSGDVPPDPAPACAQAASSASPSSAQVTPIDGTWEIKITRADLLAANPPPDPGEDQPGNYGRGTIDFHAGQWVLLPPPGQHGTFSIAGNEITLEASNGEEFKATWSIYRDTLTFGVGVPTPWRAKPLHRVNG